MEDTKIIDLFFARNEDAIAETDAAYGRKLFALSHRILNNQEDAEESVSGKSFLPSGPSFSMRFLLPSAAIYLSIKWTGAWLRSGMQKLFL